MKCEKKNSEWWSCHNIIWNLSHEAQKLMVTKAKAKELDSKTLILQHYKEDADGLCTALGDPLAREGGAAYSVDKTAFIESGWTIKREEITVSGQCQYWRCLY